MYIQPNSKIYICANVPLDEKHENTYLFNSKQEQIYYINNYFIASFDKYSYQRIGRGYLKVEASADDLYGANYMTFQNTAYGNKWFFAFIKSVDYINDNVSKINYEIDPVQTWMFDWTLGQCFVEREHSATDNIGDNLIPENLGFGEVMYAGDKTLLKVGGTRDVSSNTFTPCVIVVAPFIKNGLSTVGIGQIAGGLYTGLRYNIFYDYWDNNNVHHTILDQLNDFFQQVFVAVKESQIVTMFYYIKEFATRDNDGTGTPPVNNIHYADSFSKNYIGFKNNYNNSNEQPYVPRNNKLFTAPYNYFTITDWTGNEQDYYYEYFSTPNCQFLMVGAPSCEPAIAFMPAGYMGTGYTYLSGESTGLSEFANPDYTFWYKEFPRVPWSTDGFIAWMAQTGVALAGKVAGDFLGSGGLSSMAHNWSAGNTNQAARWYDENQLQNFREKDPETYGNIHMDYEPMSRIGGGTNVNRYIGACFANGAIAALRGRRVGGRMASASNWAISNNRVSVVYKKIRKDWAKRIDQYFDMFGYACNEVKVPNISIRPSWNYVKTVDCEIHGNIPADDIKKLKDIFDNGIRFWHQTKTIGDYTQNNDAPSPI